MAKQSTRFFPIGYRNPVLTIASGSTTLTKLMDAGADDSLISKLVCVNQDTNAITLRLVVKDGGGTARPISTVTINASAGYDGVEPAADLLALNWVSGHQLELKAGYSLWLQLTAAAGADVHFFAACEDF